MAQAVMVRGLLAVVSCAVVACSSSKQADPKPSDQKQAATDAGAVAKKPKRRARPTGPFKVGKPAPELLLPALADGKPTSLARFRGKKTLLIAFASW